MTQYDSFLQQLPPESRVEAALILEKMANDRNSPIFGLYSVVLASIAAQGKETESRLIKKLAEVEQREEQFAAQLKKANIDNLKILRQEIGIITGKTIWFRMIASKFTAAVFWVIGSYWLINTQISTIKNTVDKIKNEQTEILAKFSDNPQGIVDFANASLQVAKTSNDHAAMVGGIAALLSTPEAVAGIRDGKLTIKIRSEHIDVKPDGTYTYLRIHDEMPPIFGRIEDHLDDADKALNIKE